MITKPLPYGGKTYLQVLDEALEYILDRQSGKVTSFKTPWVGLDDIGINGLEWGSMFTIAARPGAGKTMITAQILREAYRRNPTQSFNVLEFQFEMGTKQYGSRAFAAEIALDYNVVLSSKKALDEFSVKMMRQFREETEKMYSMGIERIFLGKPMGHDSIYKAVHEYYNLLGGKPMIITIDHSWLVKKSTDEKEKINTLYNTVEMLMKLKNELPIVIIMLSQLNRNIDEAVRKIPGTIANYPTASDIFGGDALMQGSDMLVVINNPAKNDVYCYGPQKFKADKTNIFMHLIKVRNGANDSNLLFFKAEFNRQRMIEILPPPADNPGGTTDYIPRSERRGSKQISADIGSEL